VPQCWPGNAAIVTRRKAVANPEGVPFFYTSLLGAQHAFHKDAYYLPIRLRPQSVEASKQSSQQASLTAVGSEAVTPSAVANLSPKARSYLTALGVADPDADVETSGLVWMHTLAVGYSSAYQAENADGLRQDWPRIPLPNSGMALHSSAAYGRQVAALLDTQVPAAAVTTGTLRPFVRFVGTVSRVGGAPLNAEGGELALSTGWGYVSQGGIVMPGHGKLVERDYSPSERTSLDSEARELGLTADDVLILLGETTYDVFLNDAAYWSCIPKRVWDYTIGGYQRLIKKWLSYREVSVLHRHLTPEEIRNVTSMARRITALMLMEPALNRNYDSVTAANYNWQHGA